MRLLGCQDLQSPNLQTLEDMDMAMCLKLHASILVEALGESEEPGLKLDY